MHIDMLMATDTEANHLLGTITLREGKLVVTGPPDSGLDNILTKTWPVLIDATEIEVDPRVEPKLFLRYAHRIFKSPSLRATVVRED